MIQHIDRVPTKPNRYAVYDDNHNFLRYEYHERADEPTQEGNPINKVLQDEFLAASGTTAGTGAALTLSQTGFSLFIGAAVRIKLHTELGEEPTLNIESTGVVAIKTVDLRAPAGLAAGAYITLIYNGYYWILQGNAVPEQYVVGDITLTMRTDLSDEWLQCDGTAVTIDEHPELCPLLGPTPSGQLELMSPLPTTSGGRCLRYLNGYWLLMTNGGGVFYATNINGPWTRITSIDGYTFVDAAYGNGYWMVCGASGTETAWAYAADITGVWTVTVKGSYGQANGITFGGGSFVIVTQNACVYNATVPTGTWGYVDNGTYYHKAVTYGNGYWAIASGTGTYGRVFYTNNLAGSWTSASPNNSAGFTSIVYTGEYFVAVGGSGNLVYSTNLSTWTSNLQGSTSLNDIKIIGKYVVAVGSSGVFYYTEDITGTWISNLQSSGVSMGSIASDGTTIASVQNSSSSAIWLMDAEFFLPLIDLEAYAYIKAA